MAIRSTLMHQSRIAIIHEINGSIINKHFWKRDSLLDGWFSNQNIQRHLFTYQLEIITWWCRFLSPGFFASQYRQIFSTNRSTAIIRPSKKQIFIISPSGMGFARGVVYFCGHAGAHNSNRMYYRIGISDEDSPLIGLKTSSCHTRTWIWLV
jgi:hypothetical protein